MENFFNTVAAMSSVSSDTRFMSFLGLNDNLSPAMLKDDSKFGGYLCWAKQNEVSACIHYSGEFSGMMSDGFVSTITTDLSSGRHRGIEYFFDKSLMVALSASSSEMKINDQCDMYPPGMLGSGETGTTAEAGAVDDDEDGVGLPAAKRPPRASASTSGAGTQRRRDQIGAVQAHHA